MVRTEMDYGRELVRVIEQSFGRPLEARVGRAFEEVPRDVFVEQYYEGGQLRLAPSRREGEDWEAWLSLVYGDEALTTRVDGRGRPVSSSSQPSVMAFLLEQLEVQEGHCVLEIGTGTGYNAALLARLAGASGRVTTVDVDPELVGEARGRIEGVVGRVITVECRDGLGGYPPDAPFDRIMVTGSWLVVAQAWVDQLVVGGRLVMNLRGGLAGGLLTLLKHDHGHASGTFAHDFGQVSFMSLQGAQKEGREKGSSLVQEDNGGVKELAVLEPGNALYGVAAHFCDYEVFRGHAWNFWLQWVRPALQVRWRGNPADGMMEATLVDEEARLTLMPGSACLVVRGDEGLWLDLVREHAAWDQAGRPAPSDYQLLVFKEQQFLCVCEGRGRVRVFQVSC